MDQNLQYLLEFIQQDSNLLMLIRNDIIKALNQMTPEQLQMLADSIKTPS